MARAPSSVLQARYKAMIAAIGTTVTYFRFRKEGGNVDPVTEEPINEGRTTEDAVAFTAYLKFKVSNAVRDRFGLDKPFEATMEVPQDTLSANDVTLRIGDHITTTTINYPLYVVGYLPTKPIAGGFLAYIVALSRKKGKDS